MNRLAVVLLVLLSGCADTVIAPSGRIAPNAWSIAARFACTFRPLTCAPQLGTVATPPHGRRNDSHLVTFPEN